MTLVKHAGLAWAVMSVYLAENFGLMLVSGDQSGVFRFFAQLCN
jgi:hypothetical protein